LDPSLATLVQHVAYLRNVDRFSVAAAGARPLSDSVETREGRLASHRSPPFVVLNTLYERLGSGSTTRAAVLRFWRGRVND